MAKRVYREQVRENMNASRRRWDSSSGTITRTYRLKDDVAVAFDIACSLAGETKKAALERLMLQYARNIMGKGAKEDGREDSEPKRAL